MNFLLITFFFVAAALCSTLLTYKTTILHTYNIHNECRHVHMYESALNMPGSRKEPIYDSSCYLGRLSDDNVVKSFFTFFMVD